MTFYAISNGIIAPSGEIDRQTLCKSLHDLDIHFEDRGNGSETYIGDRCVEKEIRSLAVSDRVSPIAAIPEVREYVDEKLREFGKKKRVVMDGRDIGTTVFPDAEIKIFMTADPMIRAQRRLKELESKGEKNTIDEVLRNIKERDFIDSHREVSPLVKADDAVVLDNSNMSIDQQLDWVKKLIKDRFNID